MLADAEPEIFRPVPGGWGKSGSTNVRLAVADQATLESALMMAWSHVAAKARPRKIRAEKLSAKRKTVKKTLR